MSNHHVPHMMQRQPLRRNGTYNNCDTAFPMKNIATFNTAAEAHLLCAHLAGNGIEGTMRDENVVMADWLLSNAVGGVKVDVADEDYETAIAIVRMQAASPSASPREGRARKHSGRRYVRLFPILFLGLFAATLWHLGWPAFDTALICSLAIAGGITAILALFDL